MTLKRTLGLAALAFATALFPASAETIKIGVTPGAHAEILEVVKPIAAKNGVEIEIIEFSDYVVPNEALNAGELDANSFQHKPYLDNQIADRGYELESVAETVNFPIGIYSKKHKSWDQVPDGATVAIPNDPTNGGRALLVLQDKGVLKLTEGTGFKPTVADIVENPKNLRFLELDAAQTPRSLDDVDAAAINTNYATPVGLKPNRDSILQEDPKGPYVNLIVVRTVDKGKPWIKTLVEAYHSPEVKAFVTQKYDGAVLASW